MSNGILSIEAIRQGFYLKEPDDHVVELWCKGKKIATYSQTGVTLETLNHDVSQRLYENKN